MSEENVEIVRGVRTPVTVSIETRRRTLDEWLLVRFPALVRAFAPVYSRLSPRLRRAWTARIMRQGCEAANRRDWDFPVLFFHPEIELEIGRRNSGFVLPDMLGVHRGHEGYLRVWEGVIEAYEDAKLEHAEVIDFGDRLLAAVTCGGTRHTRASPSMNPSFRYSPCGGD
jgi:hypothetical protein